MNPPSLFRRIGALVIDWVIAAFSAGALFGVSYPPKNVGENLVIVAFFIVEVALLTGTLGFSIGKKVAGLVVENPAGRPIGIPRALVRTALMSIVLPAVIMTDDKRGLHDLAAGSRVIRAVPATS